MVRRKEFLLAVIVLLWALLVSVVAAFPVLAAEGRTASGVALVYTSDLMGQYNAVAGDSADLGGFAIRASFLSALKKDAANVVQVDAGDVFYDDPTVAMLLPEQYKMTAEFIAKTYATMGVAAVAVGEGDLALGLDVLRNVQRESNLTLLCANLVDLRGNPVFPGSRIIDVGGAKLGIVGLMGQEFARQISEGANYALTVDNPVTVARKEVASLRDKVDYVVVLTHQSVEADKTLAASVPGIDVIVGGHDRQGSVTPIRIGKTLLVQAGERGQRVGVLTLNAGQVEANTSYTLSAEKYEPDPDMQTAVDEFEAELHRRCGC